MGQNNPWRDGQGDTGANHSTKTGGKQEDEVKGWDSHVAPSLPRLGMLACQNLFHHVELVSSKVLEVPVFTVTCQTSDNHKFYTP